MNNFYSPKDDATRKLIIIPESYKGSRPMFGGSFSLAHLTVNTNNFVTVLANKLDCIPLLIHLVVTLEPKCQRFIVTADPHSEPTHILVSIGYSKEGLAQETNTHILSIQDMCG